MHKPLPAGDAALFRGPMPRYAQLADIFRQRIARNRWPQGTKLPTLEALMREFGVARVTVRQAMELLARDGLVSAERGRGTFVMAQPVRDRGLRLETSLQALADVYRNDTPNLTLIEEAAATPQLFERDGAPASAYRFMRRVHSRNGETYSGWRHAASGAKRSFLCCSTCRA
jgi:GntR family transcriptional regulator